MPDSQALLASLLMGQRRRADPLEEQRKYGRSLLTAGSDTSPVLTPWQGLARALQGGIGGAIEGWTDKQQEAQDTKNIDILTNAATLNKPAEIAAALKGLKGNSEMVIPVLGQIIQSRLDSAIGNEKAGTTYNQMVPPGGVPQPGYGAATAPGNFPQGQLASLESRNNPTAVNPKSGAAGSYQFMPETWAEVRAKNPDLNLPENPLQADAKLQAAAEQRFRASNAQELQAAGIPPNPATLYLAHRVGVKGVQTLLSTSPDTPMSVVVPPKWIEQNPDMRTTVGSFINNAAQRIQGQSQPQAQPQPAGGAQIAQPQVAQAAPPQAPQGQPPIPQGSEAGNRLRAEAARLHAQGNSVEAVKRLEEATKEDAKFASAASLEQFKQAQGQPQQTVTNEGKLRDDFRQEPVVKAYREVVPIMESVKEAVSRPSRAADLNLVYGLAKIMDPNSVVREGEMVMVRNTGTIGDWLSGQIGRLNGGAELQPETRAKIVEEMQSRYKGLEDSHNTVAEVYKGIAQRSGMNPENVIVPIRKGKPEAQAGQPAPGGGSDAVYDMNGKRIR